MAKYPPIKGIKTEYKVITDISLSGLTEKVEALINAPRQFGEGWKLKGGAVMGHVCYMQTLIRSNYWE